MRNLTISSLVFFLFVTARVCLAAQDSVSELDAAKNELEQQKRAWVQLLESHKKKQAVLEGRIKDQEEKVRQAQARYRQVVSASKAKDGLQDKIVGSTREALQQKILLDKKEREEKERLILAEEKKEKEFLKKQEEEKLKAARSKEIQEKRKLEIEEKAKNAQIAEDEKRRLS